jgi:putative (di)nucleoside polyphosphate hydrolase
MASETMRAGVVIVIRHPSADLVMVFERSDVVGAWQLPQGGLDVGESPLDAAWREMAEETGLTVDEVELVSVREEWIGYLVPEWARHGRRFVGQSQQWFTFQARAADIEARPDQHEFRAWKWISPAELVDHVVEFRRASYRAGLGPR